MSKDSENTSTPKTEAKAESKPSVKARERNFAFPAYGVNVKAANLKEAQSKLEKTDEFKAHKKGAK